MLISTKQWKSRGFGWSMCLDLQKKYLKSVIQNKQVCTIMHVKNTSNTALGCTGSKKYTLRSGFYSETLTFDYIMLF